MKTLYVSDLDGTLLRSDESMSDDTNTAVNKLIEKGMMFSYATARSLVTARKVAKGLDTRIPLIVYNGCFIVNPVSGEIVRANSFDESFGNVLGTLLKQQVYPIVYSYIDGIEKFSFIAEHCSRGMAQFLESRRGDPRINPVKTAEQLAVGNPFYITCIDEPEKLAPLYHGLKERYHAVYQKDIYSGEQWLEILPKGASKANAALQLKELLQCDRLVVFGDGMNDIDMFEIADEAYAVENAVSELKGMATGIIGGNNGDGVAKWLTEHCCGKA